MFLLTYQPCALKQKHQTTSICAWLIQNSTLRYALARWLKHSGPRFVIHGDLGSFIKQGIDPQHQQLKKGITPCDNQFGKEQIDDWGSLYTNNSDEEILVPSPAGDYCAFYRHLFDTIRHQAPLPCDNQLAVDMVQIIEASQQSNESKQVVTL